MKGLAAASDKKSSGSCIYIVAKFMIGVKPSGRPFFWAFSFSFGKVPPIFSTTCPRAKMSFYKEGGCATITIMEEQLFNHREDEKVDITLRPTSWQDFVGQERVKENIRIAIDAAKKRREVLEHMLLSGPAGLGKTTLAHLISYEMETTIKVTSGPAIERVSDLAALLTNLNPGEILFIDEVHRLPKAVEEILYPAMEARRLDIIVGKGLSSRTIQIDLHPFTLIAATAREGMLSGPFRGRFGSLLALDYYTEKNIEKILSRSATLLHVTIEPEAVTELAKASRFTPRAANRLLKRSRDYAEVRGNGIITKTIAKEALKLLEVDDYGLEPMDRKILSTIISIFSGGPVGLQAIAAAILQEEDTIEEIYEPYLLRIGFLERTPRGRVVTQRGYQHLEKGFPRLL